MMNKIISKIAVCFSLCILAVFSPVQAFANMMITPTSIVFSDRERFEYVTLINNGSESQSYELEIAYLKMLETGGYATLDAPFAEVDVTDFIRYAPKRLTLEPGGVQRVRLALRRSADIPEGDYHIHLKFKAISKQAELKDAGEGKIRAIVPINVSYTIPIIVRIGEPDVSAKIGQITLDRDQETGKLTAKIPVTRSAGPYGMLGFMRIYHIDGSGVETYVGELSNAYIFPELMKRIFEPNIFKEFEGGSLRVEIKYYDSNDKDFVYAERIFPLQ